MSLPSSSSSADPPGRSPRERSTEAPVSSAERGLTIERMRFRYPGNAYELVVNELRISAGERVALVGTSGIGKTTLLYLLAGILRPQEGRIGIEGVWLDTLTDRALRDLRLRRLGMIFQEFELLDHLRVRDNILLPYWIDGRLNLDRAAHDRADALLERAGLSALSRRKPAALSQGERQRVGICRALITRPSILLADEPTGNLDPETTNEILDAILDAASAEDATLVFVTHDHTLLDRLDRVIDLSDLAGGRTR